MIKKKDCFRYTKEKACTSGGVNMDLPKNTTQIGEINANYKIFIEDYVISYLKQICKKGPECKKRIALYGKRVCEDEVEYEFCYGAGEIQKYSGTGIYLAEKDYEEIERVRREYFEEFDILGFVLMEDEVPDSVYLLREKREKWISGYHIFYEKNDSMLGFMLHRQALRKKEEAVLEPKRKNEENKRKIIIEERKDEKIQNIFRVAVYLVSLVLCVIIIITMNGAEKMKDVQNFFRQGLQIMDEQILPNQEEKIPTMVSGNKEYLEKMKEENSISCNASVIKETEASFDEKEQEYIIREGETLLGISKKYYGDETHVEEICGINGIKNSNHIKVGQKIILP